MFNKKISIWIFLAVIITSCPVFADIGGFGNGGGPWQGGGSWGGGSWERPMENIPQNLGVPGPGSQQVVPPVQNIERPQLQPQPEQIKRDYNQIQREQRQQFQQNWKKIKK